MRLLLHTCDEPARDLALEEAIQAGLEAGTSPTTWRLWQAARPAVVLGTGQEHLKEVAGDEARAANVPVLRRHSGGGAVLIGPGAINYSFFTHINDLPGGETITGAMESGLRPVLRALNSLGVAAQLAGLSDVVVTGTDLRKIAGNAQARKRASVLVHGTLLAEPDWALLERVLAFPSRAPDYRAGRGHRAFLTSLKELGAPAGLEDFAPALAGVLGDLERADAPQPDESAKASELLAEKYSRAEWNLRR
ncbi:MAG: lipoate--protein ligase family protein [Planctomycetota bacterium]|nr:lipoate--protein ligase family protein [Planctomycetota bacterium]